MNVRKLSRSLLMGTLAMTAALSAGAAGTGYAASRPATAVQNVQRATSLVGKIPGSGFARGRRAVVLRKARLAARVEVAASVLLVAPSTATGGPERGGKRRAPLCLHKSGRTLERRGPVRIFRTQHGVFGCVKSSRHAWLLGRSPAQIAGPYVAIKQSSSNQYAFQASARVTDLRSGNGYAIYSVYQPISGPYTGTPSVWPAEAFVLGPDGRTVRLWDTGTMTPTGQVLDLIGFRHFARRLATAPPQSIAQRSITYNGRRVSWTKDGTRRSVAV